MYLGTEILNHTTKHLDDLIRDLSLPKSQAELLASRLSERNLLPKTKITTYRYREREFLLFFSKENSVVFCNDVKGLITLYGIGVYKPEDWRLFIDSSTESFKAVLLHNGNKYAAVPLGHSMTLKESYESFQFLLQKLDYKSHNWYICGDDFSR